MPPRLAPLADPSQAWRSAPRGGRGATFFSERPGALRAGASPPSRPEQGERRAAARSPSPRAAGAARPPLVGRRRARVPEAVHRLRVAGRVAAGRIDRAEPGHVVLFQGAERRRHGRVVGVHRRACLRGVGEAQEVARLVGEDGEQIDLDASVGRRELGLGAVELHVRVADLPRVERVGHGREGEHRARVRPRLVAEHDDVRVLEVGVVLELVAADGAEVDRGDGGRLAVAARVLPGVEGLPRELGDGREIDLRGGVLLDRVAGDQVGHGSRSRSAGRGCTPRRRRPLRRWMSGSRLRRGAERRARSTQRGGGRRRGPPQSASFFAFAMRFLASVRVADSSSRALGFFAASLSFFGTRVPRSGLDVRTRSSAASMSGKCPCAIAVTAKPSPAGASSADDRSPTVNTPSRRPAGRCCRPCRRGCGPRPLSERGRRGTPPPRCACGRPLPVADLIQREALDRLAHDDEARLGHEVVDVDEDGDGRVLRATSPSRGGRPPPRRARARPRARPRRAERVGATGERSRRRAKPLLEAYQLDAGPSIRGLIARARSAGRAGSCRPCGG